MSVTPVCGLCGRPPHRQQARARCSRMSCAMFGLGWVQARRWVALNCAVRIRLGDQAEAEWAIRRMLADLLVACLCYVPPEALKAEGENPDEAAAWCYLCEESWEQHAGDCIVPRVLGMKLSSRIGANRGPRRLGLKP